MCVRERENEAITTYSYAYKNDSAGKIMQGRKRMTPEAKSLNRQEATAQMEGPAYMRLTVRKGKILNRLTSNESARAK